VKLVLEKDSLVLKTCLLGVEFSFRTKTRQFLPNEKTEKKNEKKKKPGPSCGLKTSK
jgi:hypothetical protein